jgi:hypothetical protein
LREPLDPLARALRAIEREIAGSPIEIGYVLDADGRVLVRRTGERALVDFSDLREVIRGRFVIHNHPQGNSFSESDVQLLLTFKAAEIRVATEQHAFVLPLPEGGVEWEDVADLVGWIKRDLTAADVVAYKVGGADPERLSMEFWHRVWTELSEVRGWGYRREMRR